MEWNYFKGLMAKMGFASRWIELIMSCVRTVSYSIVLNGKQCGSIVPSRELRQGDPLSPYLFLLCAEGLISLFKQAQRERTV